MEFNQDNYNSARKNVENFNDIVINKDIYENSKNYVDWTNKLYNNAQQQLKDMSPQDYGKTIKSALNQQFGSIKSNGTFYDKTLEVLNTSPEKLQIFKQPALKRIAEEFQLDTSKIDEWDFNDPIVKKYFNVLDNPNQNLDKIKLAKEEAISGLKAELESNELYNKAQKITTDYDEQQKLLNTYVDKVKNNDTTKKALNYTVNSDGSYTKESINNRDAAKQFIEQEEKNYVEAAKARHKIPLNKEVQAFMTEKDSVKKMMGQGAEDKKKFFEQIPEEIRNSLGIDIAEVGNMSEKRIESIRKSLINEDYLNKQAKAYKQQFREAINEDKRLAAIFKERASSSSSSIKTAGKYALGALAGAALVGALFFGDNKGEQTNAQLYGQQPLY